MKNFIISGLLAFFLISATSCVKNTNINHKEFEVNDKIENPVEVNKNFEYPGMLDLFNSGTGYYAVKDTINLESPAKEGFIIRNNVEILPRTKESSAVLGLLNLHDRIEILAEIGILQKDSFGDWSKNWYKISVNNIEGYIRTCCADKQKHLYNINGNIVTIYPRLANGMFDDRRHNPYFLYNRLPSYNIFINEKNVQLPKSIINGNLKGGELIDGNLHLIYSYFFDKQDSHVIISAEGDKIYIGTEEHKQYLSMEGDFIVDKDGMLYAYYGNRSDVIIPEKIAGVTVKAISSHLFRNDKYTSIKLPSTIKDIGIVDYLPTIIIDSNLDITVHTSYGFVEAYNRNGKKGGTYTHNRDYSVWKYTP